MSVGRAAIAALKTFTDVLSGPSPMAHGSDMRGDKRRGQRGQPRRKGGRIAGIPTTVTRWHQRDVEEATITAGTGDLSLAGRLYRAFRRDGIVQGLGGVRAGGLVRLPKRFLGDYDAVSFFAGAEGQSGTFDTIFPTSELELLDQDGFYLGVGVAEMVMLPGAILPTMIRLDPEYLYYMWHEDCWYYRSTMGMERVVPGDGRWILHRLGGMQEPWNNGIWQAIGRAFVSKEHAIFLRENWNSKLANAARVAYSPSAASEAQQQAWFQKVMAWGINTVFGMKPGYEVKLIESNGRGYESFRQTVEDANAEFIVCICGSKALVDGGTGFNNLDVHKAIRNDLLERDGAGLAKTLNEQALPAVLPYTLAGARVAVSWDTRPALDRKAEADSLVTAAKALSDCVMAGVAVGISIDTHAIAARLAVPTLGDTHATGNGNDTGNDNDTGIITSAPAASALPPGTSAAILGRLDKTASGHQWDGLEVHIEFRAGETQYGVDDQGHPWTRIFFVDYGSFEGTVGADGEPIDAYFGPHGGGDTVWIIKQVTADGTFDEHKVMCGFSSTEEALCTYLLHVPEQYFGAIYEVPTQALRLWLKMCGDIVNDGASYGA